MKSKLLILTSTALVIFSLLNPFSMKAQKLSASEKTELTKQTKSVKIKASEDMTSFLFTKSPEDYKKSQQAYSRADSLYGVLIAGSDEAGVKTYTAARERNTALSNLVEKLLSARDFSTEKGTTKVKYKGEKQTLEKKDQPLFDFLQKAIEEADNSKY